MKDIYAPFNYILQQRYHVLKLYRHCPMINDPTNNLCQPGVEEDVVAYLIPRYLGMSPRIRRHVPIGYYDVYE